MSIVKKEVREYYSTSECAEIFKVSRITIFNWIEKKIITAKKVAGNYVISVDEIHKLQTNRGLHDKDKQSLRSFVTLLMKEYGDFLKAIN